MIKLKDILNEASIPMSVGFKSKPDFKHGLVKEFFKFFYIPNGQPVGTFMDMASAVSEKYPESTLTIMLDNIGGVSQEIHDYLSPPGGKESPYDLHSLTQKHAAEAIWQQLVKANKLGQAIKKSAFKAPEGKIEASLRGLETVISRVKDIFTSSVGPLKKRSRIGFR